MTYQSPLHILDSRHITPDELTPEGITRLRKKLLAEFSLSSDITIDVNGQAYTKDAILKVIDQLKEVDNLVLHKAIFSRKPLLDWLSASARSTPKEGQQWSRCRCARTGAWWRRVRQGRSLDTAPRRRRHPASFGLPHGAP